MKKNSKFLMIYIITLFITVEAVAHGYVTSPVARQIACVKDGGYWGSANGSSIPNLACRNAFLQSGTYPFTQGNEFATLVSNYLNMDSVKSKAKDGLLCSGGSDVNKQGFDLPSPYWKKTKLTSGQPFEYELKGTAPHEPSFIEIYISKNSFNSATDTLSWDDLELIHREDVSFTNGLYRINLTIPVEYTGANAILYTRWQRYDPVGEGFYNCSDISLSNTPIEEIEEESLENNSSVVTPSVPVAKASARPHILKGSGEVVLSASESDNNTNLTYQWTQISGPTIQIANINAEYTNISLGEVNETTVYMFKLSVNNSNGTDETNVSVTQYPQTSETNNTQNSNNQNSDNNLTIDYAYPNGLGSYIAGSVVKVNSSNNVYRCKPFPYSAWCNGASLYYAPETGLAWKQAWNRIDNEDIVSDESNSSVDSNTSNQIPTNNDTNSSSSCSDGVGIPNWSSQGIYLAGSAVQHNRKFYKAKWWTQNDEPPASVPSPPWSSPWVFLGSCAPFLDGNSTATISLEEAVESGMDTSSEASIPPIVVDSNDTEVQEQATQAAATITQNTQTPAVPPVIASKVPSSDSLTEQTPQTLPNEGYAFLRLLTIQDWDWFFPLRSGKYVSSEPCSSGEFQNCGGGTRNQPPIANQDGTTDVFTLDSFIKATLAYNEWAKKNNYKQFLNEGTLKQQAQEFAAFWAKTSRETSGSWSTASEPWIVNSTIGSENLVVWKGGLYWVEEVGYSTKSDGTSSAINYVDAGSTLYPPVPGRSYYGRGVIQLSWNYNYGAFSYWLYDNGFLKDVITSRDILLRLPNLVAENGTLSTLAGIWFWMTPQGAKPSSHDVIHGDIDNISNATQDRGLPQTNQASYIPKTASGDTDDQEVFAYRLGTITNIVNGGLECNKAAKWHHGPVQRAYYYDTYAAYLNNKYGVQATRLDDVKAISREVWNGSITDSSSNVLQSATCYNQKSYYGW